MHRQRVEAVRVNNCWFIRRFDDPANQTPNIVRLAQTRADGNDVGGDNQALERGNCGFQMDQSLIIVR